MSAGRPLLFLLLSLPLLPAQTEAPKPDEKPKITKDSPLGDPAALPDGAPAQMAEVDRADLRRHVFWLADDARRGRYTGSPQQLEVAEYLAEQFQQLGLEPLGDKKGFLQRYPLDVVALDVAGTSLQFGNTKITSGYAVLPTGESEKVTTSGRFLYCGTGRPDEVPNGIKGRIPVVVIMPPKEPPVDPSAKPKLGDPTTLPRAANIAREFGNEGAAAGVICLLGGTELNANALNYGALLPDHPRFKFMGRGGGPPGGRVPVLFLAAAESKQLLAAMGVHLDEQGIPERIEPGVKLNGKLQITVKHDAKGSATNVAALLPGKDKKKEAVLFAAHMDHLGTRIDGDAFNGADDNASGTAALLEIAQAFVKGERPSRSVLFLAVSGEELGMFGSAWYTDNPTYPLDQIIAGFNVDMIGRAKNEGGSLQLLLTPSFQHDKYSTLGRSCTELGRRFGFAFASGDPFWKRSDHIHFANKGVPMVFVSDGEPPQYHQVDDSPDTLDYAGMEAIARLLFWTGYHAANDKERPKVLGPQQGW